MAVIILVAILFNIYPHKIGAYGILNGELWSIPLLAPIFSVYLPLWNLYWLLTLGLNFTLLSMRRWTRATRWVELGLLAFSWVLVYWIVTGSGILGFTPQYLDLNNTSPAAIRLTEETLIPILSTVLQVLLIVHLVVKGLKIVYKLFRNLGRPPIITFNPRNGPES